MAVSGIQGQLLEITVVGCSKLKNTEWISRQDPYVYLEYANNKFRTRTCTDGGKNPIFQEKFVFTLIEGLREINVAVWNSNTMSCDDFIGSGKIQLQRVLSSGYDDSSWPIQTKNGRHAGEVRLIMHYNKPVAASSYGVSLTSSYSQNSPYGYTPPPPPPPYVYPPQPAAYAPPPPPPAYYSSQPQPAYTQTAYSPLQSQNVYPPPSSTYPPSTVSTYPPPPQPQWGLPYPPPQQGTYGGGAYPPRY